MINFIGSVFLHVWVGTNKTLTYWKRQTVLDDRTIKVVYHHYKVRDMNEVLWWMLKVD